MKNVPELSKSLIKHKTIGIKQGDWVIYRCSQCDYELHDNLATHELVIKNAKPDISHSGVYKPFKVEQAMSMPLYPRAVWGLN
jgi:hypothetical protein